MDEEEFERLLALFPVVRSRDFQVESELSTSQSAPSEPLKEQKIALNEKGMQETEGIDSHDPFWEKLKLAAAKKVGASEAERFCKIFQKIYKELVCKGLSLDAARSFLNSSSSSPQ